MGRAGEGWLVRTGGLVLGGAGEVTRLVELVGLVTVDLLVEVYRGVLFEGGLLWGALVGRRRVVLAGC